MAEDFRHGCILMLDMADDAVRGVCVWWWENRPKPQQLLIYRSLVDSTRWVIPVAVKVCLQGLVSSFICEFSSLLEISRRILLT